MILLLRECNYRGMY